VRTPALALVMALVAALGAFVPTTVASGDPRIVIIVGAVHGATDTYRSRANAAYAEAIKYSSNVKKVYSPNATWSKVKAAVKGASIVIYMGHGNGWPSPYTYDPNYTTKDGFGLNATAGNGDHNNKYYGEPSIRTLEFAPNALVLLHHLCYASGNSESGHAEPSVSVARKRVSNYAEPFLRAGAAAVIAEGHRGPERILRDLFTTNQTIEQLWLTQPNAHGNVSTFPSTRSPAFTAYTDTNTPSGGYYRSLVTRLPNTTTGAIVGGGVDTGADPADFAVPGRAEVSTDGAPLYAGSNLQGEPVESVPAGTRLEVVARPLQSTTEGDPLIEVIGLDDPSISGFMAAPDLTPRDSLSPRIWSIDTGLGVFSPNGDGVADTITIGARLSETAAWRVRFLTSGGTVLAEETGSGRDVSAAWDGLVGGTPIAGGTYRYEIRAEDAWANPATTFSGTILADLTPPDLSSVTPAAETVPWFSPNGDGVRDTVALGGTMSEAGSIAVRVRNEADATVHTFVVTAAAGPNSFTWNGRDGGKAVVPDGTYAVRLTPRDAVGNVGTAITRHVQVVTVLSHVATSKARFYPQDLDRLSKTTKLSFVLTRPATVTWELRNAAGQVVETRLAAGALAAGTHAWTFRGRRSDGTMLPVGRYTSVVTADDGTFVAAQSVGFEMNAFTIKPSTKTPKRGAKMSVTTISAETLSTAPRLYIYQPGKSVWSVAMKKTATSTWKATFTLKKGGSAGTVKFKVVAKDRDGRKQRTTLGVPLL
jgi:flagellar hook assembly protein FlgD